MWRYCAFTARNTIPLNLPAPSASCWVLDCTFANTRYFFCPQFCQCLLPSANILLLNHRSTLNAELTLNSNASLSSAAPTDAQTAVNNFLASLRGNNNLAQGEEGGDSQGQGPYTTLSDLLTTSTTIPVINNATEAQLDNFLSYLPPTVLLLAQESSAQIDGMVEPTSGTAQAALEALSVSQKRAILKRVLHSPQFSQGLGSLTMALQQGGLPSVAEALKIKVDNKAMYAQGGEAVRQFVEGIKKSVVEEGQ